MPPGWIMLHREIMESSIWEEKPFDRARAWIDLILLAKFKPGYERVRGVRVELKRGQLIASERLLAERWGWDRKKVRKFLNELGEDDRIAPQKNNVTTVVTIVNYDDYQKKEPQRGPQTVPQSLPQTGPQRGPQTSISCGKNRGENAPKKDKKDKKEKKERKEEVSPAPAERVAGPSGSEEDSRINGNQQAGATLFAVDDECVYPVFPTKPGKRTKETSWRLSEQNIQRLQEAFPGVDVHTESRKAHVWTLANPSKQKTAGGMEDFLFRWMERQQNRGGFRSQSGQKPKVMRSNYQPPTKP